MCSGMQLPYKSYLSIFINQKKCHYIRTNKKIDKHDTEKLILVLFTDRQFQSY